MAQLVTGITLIALTFGASWAAAATSHEDRETCLNTILAVLSVEKNQSFEGPQIGIVCGISKLDATGTQCEREEKTKEFSYQAPAGFQIGSAEFRVQTKSKYTTLGEVLIDGRTATVTLQCIGRPCDIPGHELVRGRIVGHLLYQPTADDRKAIEDECRGGPSE